MQTTITVRHCEIPEELRDRARQIVDRLGAVAPKPLEVTVVFDVDGLSRVAEVRLVRAGGDALVARGEASDHRTALDRAEAKLRRQAARAAERPRRSRPMPQQP